MQRLLKAQLFRPVSNTRLIKLICVVQDNESRIRVQIRASSLPASVPVRILCLSALLCSLYPEPKAFSITSRVCRSAVSFYRDERQIPLWGTCPLVPTSKRLSCESLFIIRIVKIKSTSLHHYGNALNGYRQIHTKLNTLPI